MNWLNANFGNVFGNTFTDGLGGDTAAEVASFYKNQFFSQKLKATPKVDAQFMATAFATFFTSSNLSGRSVAASYGFNVTQTGIGTKVVNIGSNGAAFGVANNSNMTIMAILLATNELTENNGSGYRNIYDTNGDGVLDDREKALRVLANNVTRPSMKAETSSISSTNGVLSRNLALRQGLLARGFFADLNTANDDGGNGLHAETCLPPTTTTTWCPRDRTHTGSAQRNLKLAGTTGFAATPLRSIVKELTTDRSLNVATPASARIRLIRPTRRQIFRQRCRLMLNRRMALKSFASRWRKMIDAESLAFLKRSTPRNHHGVRRPQGRVGRDILIAGLGADTLDGGAAHELWSDTDFDKG